MVEEQDGLISIDEAVERLSSSRSTVYRWLKTGALKGVKVGRQWRVHPDELARFTSGEGPRIAATPGVAGFRDEVLRLLDMVEDETPPPDAIVMSTVALTTQVALSRTATHFAIEPHIGEDGEIRGWFRVRTDGALTVLATLDRAALAPLVEGWKRWAGCDPHRVGEIQSGRAVLARGDDLPLDLRITIVPSVLGEAVEVTVLDPLRAAEHIDLDRLDFDAADRARIDRALGAPWGTTIVTGPSGSGKSTFLYACLRQLARPARKAIAVEDPVEWRIPGVMHIPVQEDRGVTFPAAIRAAMHCDPDVVMVSEVRDRETLELAPSIALVGHLVLTALHAPTSVAALMRMAEFGLERHTIAEATRLIVAQQLVRRLCPACCKAGAPERGELERACEIAAANHVELDDDWHVAVGCAACSDTGYRGRRLIAETVEMTPALRAALLSGGDSTKLWEVALADGSSSLVADGIRRASRGETTLDEVWRVTS